MFVAITGLPLSPVRSKPTTPTPSRAVGCALRGGPARKSPAGGRGQVALRFRGLPLATTANPSTPYHSRLHSARENSQKKPRRSGAKSVMWAAKKQEETSAHIETIPQKRLQSAGDTRCNNGSGAPQQQQAIKPPPEQHTHPPRCLPGCRGPASHRKTNTLGPHFASRGPSFHHEMLHAVAVACSRRQQQHRAGRASINALPTTGGASAMAARCQLRREFVPMT